MEGKRGNARGSYILGGVVDRNRYPGLTYKQALEQGNSASPPPPSASPTLFVASDAALGRTLARQLLSRVHASETPRGRTRAQPLLMLLCSQGCRRRACP
jgi:hypothetical protein